MIQDEDFIRKFITDRSARDRALQHRFAYLPDSIWKKWEFPRHDRLKTAAQMEA